MKRHLPYSVRRTREARIEATDTGLDTIQNSFSDFIAVDIPGRELTHSAVHSEIILRCGDNEVYFLQHTVVIHPVMMEQGSARGFTRADALGAVNHGFRANVRPENCRIICKLIRKSLAE